MIFFYLVFFLQNAQSSITFKWLGISNFILSDQKTTLMFDPAITRASLWDFILFQKFESNTEEVDYWLNRCDLKKLDAIFVNHTHYDHAIDASYITKKFQNKLYGSRSLVNMSLGQGVAAHLPQEIQFNQKIQVGDFTIEAFNTPHAPHFLDYMLMDGDISHPFPKEPTVWDYKVGETFSYLITHPMGKILFQAIGRVEDQDPLKNIKANVLLITIANRRSSEELINKRIIPTAAEKIIPLHHDNFFFDMKRQGNFNLLWGINLEEFKTKTKSFNIIYPEYCQEILLLSKIYEK